MEWENPITDILLSYYPPTARQNQAGSGLINGEYINKLEETRIRKGLPLMEFSRV